MCGSVRNAGRQGIAACAISALDIALWDLKARLLEVPLAVGATALAIGVAAVEPPTQYSRRRP